MKKTVLHCMICGNLFDKNDLCKPIKPPLNTFLRYENCICYKCEKKLSKGEIPKDMVV